MAGFENDVMVGKNVNFDLAAAKPHLGVINAAGKLPIGTGHTYPTPEILGGSLTSPNGTISFGYSSPNITADVVDKNVAPIGALQYFASGGSDTTYPGPQWLKCDGSIISQATYNTLFTRVGLINGAGSIWTSVKPTVSYSLAGVAYGNSTYARIANSGGSGNYMATSTDGITWVNGNSGTSSLLSCITYGAVFVYGSTGGTLATSTDAITWTQRTTGVATTITNIGYNGSRYAFNSGGLMYSSTDAITWTQYPTPNNAALNKWTSNGSLFAAASSDWNFVTSTDGITWQTRTPTIGNVASSSGTKSLLYTGGKYYGAGNTPSVILSSDALTWTAVSSGSATSGYNAIINGGNFVIGGNGGAISSSTDGITWTSRTSNTASVIYALAYGNSTYVYGTAGGGGGTSTDGTTWVSHNTGSGSQVRSITYGSVFVYGLAGGAIFTSTDGVTFTSRTSGTTSTIQCINFFNNLYVYAGGNGALATSTDAITWTARTSGTTSSIFSMTYGTSYVYSGAGGIVATSTDAITWTQRYSGTVSSLDSLTYDGTQYYAFPAGGNGFFTSTDAITWNPIINPTQTAQCIAYGGEYVIGGLSGEIYSTTDFSTLTPRSGITGYLSAVSSIIYANGKYTAVGFTQTPVSAAAYVGSSTDGHSWFPVKTDNTSNFQQVIYGDKYVAVGNNGATMTASGTYSYNSVINFQLPVDNRDRLTYESQDNFYKTLYIRAT